MRRAAFAVISLAALAACDPPVPDSGAGVGFGSYAEYQARREAELIEKGARAPSCSRLPCHPKP